LNNSKLQTVELPSKPASIVFLQCKGAPVSREVFVEQFFAMEDGTFAFAGRDIRCKKIGKSTSVQQSTIVFVMKFNYLIGPYQSSFQPSMIPSWSDTSQRIVRGCWTALGRATNAEMCNRRSSCVARMLPPSSITLIFFGRPSHRC
jgi:hypothetical protein